MINIVPDTLLSQVDVGAESFSDWWGDWFFIHGEVFRPTGLMKTEELSILTDTKSNTKNKKFQIML